MRVPHAKLLLSSASGKSHPLIISTALLRQSTDRAFVFTRFIPEVHTERLVHARWGTSTAQIRASYNYTPRTLCTQPYSRRNWSGDPEVCPSASRSFCRLFLFTAFARYYHKGPSRTRSAPCTTRPLFTASLLLPRLADHYTCKYLLSPSRRLFTLATMTASNYPMPSAELLTDKMETPALDDRSYRVIRLPNKLEALLVHDPETDKASAAMDVNVGNFSDRSDMPGMAHAVEHLLFMGTEKVCYLLLVNLTGLCSNTPPVPKGECLQSIPHIQLWPFECVHWRDINQLLL
jgi:Insulinase (Peptidase family M16)